MWNDPIVPEADLLKLLLKSWLDDYEEIEKRILKLEVQYHDHELIDGLLDRIHRIKRGAAYAGLTVIMEMIHELEVALHTVRDHIPVIHAELIDLLLSAVEVLHQTLRYFYDQLDRPGQTKLEDALATEAGAKTKWHDVVHRLHDYLENIRLTATGGMDDKTEESGKFSDPTASFTKEQFLFEMYEQLDRMANDLFGKLEQDETSRDAIHALIMSVQRIGNCIGTYSSRQSASVPDVVLKNLLNVVQLFENMITLIRDKQQAFTQTHLNLGQAFTDLFKTALEAVAQDNPASLVHTDLLDSIHHEISKLASLPDPDREKGTDGLPLSASSNTDASEPVSKAVLPQSIRVSQDKLDKMMNMISELLIAKNAFMHLSAKLNVEYNLPELSKELKEVGFSVNRISDELQNTIMSIRMVEVKTVFQKMPRIIRDVAQLTGKKMELAMVGETTEIDKTIIEQISDPLVHLIRNAADHGIENSEERLRKGKSEIGTITLRAYNKDKHVYIEIEDDGKGMDPEAIKQKALEKGFLTPENAEKMTKSQLINLIFLPGFSTAKQLTEVSGRGVGMDIVKNNIEKINGSIQIDSEMDKGTKVVIRLPLTLAISRGLIVEVAQETYIIPIESISKTVKINRNDIHVFNDKYFASLQGEVIGIEWMSILFMLGERAMDQDGEFNAVIVSNGLEKFGLIVDRLRNEQEFVIKTFSGHLARIPGISGSTLLGNGQVVLIINPIDLIQLAKNG
jgi:two-component system chemotaxis sensor kinase CheA